MFRGGIIVPPRSCVNRTAFQQNPSGPIGVASEPQTPSEYESTHGGHTLTRPAYPLKFAAVPSERTLEDWV